MPGPISQNIHNKADIHGAIARSARATDMNFDFLLGQAKIESGLNPNAKASTSSATGLFQFIEQSWLEIIDKHGEKYGLGWASNAIHKQSNGRLTVSDNATRQSILNMRKNPEIASLMAAELASDNKEYLESKLGRKMGNTDLYLGHFLGAGGARKFLSAMEQNSGQSAAQLFPSAARANRNIFYNRNGSAKSLGQIYNHFTQKINDASANITPPAIYAQNGIYGNGGNALPQSGKSMPVVAPADYLRIAHRQQTSPPLELGQTNQNNSASLAYMMLAALGA